MAGGFKEISAEEIQHHYYYVWNPSGRDSLYDEKGLIIGRITRNLVLEVVTSRLRLKVAEFAPKHVFVHAGVVGWKGKAIVIPGRSLSGKTTLTAEFLSRGALYYSDEYAIIDANGFVSPFPKTLSIRETTGSADQVERPIEYFGGRVGRRKIPVGLVLVTQYKQNARWKPAALSNGNGLIEILKNTLPIRSNPQLSLKVLSKVVESAPVIKTQRREADRTVDMILELLEDGFSAANDYVKKEADRTYSQWVDRRHGD